MHRAYDQFVSRTKVTCHWCHFTYQVVFPTQIASLRFRVFISQNVAGVYRISSDHSVSASRCFKNRSWFAILSQNLTQSTEYIEAPVFRIFFRGPSTIGGGSDGNESNWISGLSISIRTSPLSLKRSTWSGESGVQGWSGWHVRMWASSFTRLWIAFQMQCQHSAELSFGPTAVPHMSQDSPWAWEDRYMACKTEHNFETYTAFLEKGSGSKCWIHNIRWSCINVE